MEPYHFKLVNSRGTPCLKLVITYLAIHISTFVVNYLKSGHKQVNINLSPTI